MSREKLIRLTRTNLLQIVTIFILIGAISFWSMGGCSSNNNGDSFPQPPEINSRNGVLSTILETLIAANFIENSEAGEIDEVNTPTYNGNLADFGTVTFRTYLDPLFPGDFVFHCHILTHEDVGMMQKLTVLP